MSASPLSPFPSIQLSSDHWSCADSPLTTAFRRLSEDYEKPPRDRGGGRQVSPGGLVIVGASSPTRINRASHPRRPGWPTSRGLESS